jgi:hypothetical protein
MYIVHIPERPEVDPVLRSTLESAELVRDEMNTQAGSQCAVIDLIHTTVRFTNKGKQDE